MNDKEKWKAEVEVFGSIESGDRISMAKKNETPKTWEVFGEGFSDSGNRFLDIRRRGRSCCHNQRLYLTQFIAWNAVLVPSPDPEKSEADKLLASLDKDSIFWTQRGDDDSTIVKWIVSEALTRTCVSARKTSQPGVTVTGLDAGWFERNNATATRPETEREVELEDEISQTEQAFTDYVEGAIEDSEYQKKEIDLLARHNQNQGEAIRASAERIEELEQAESRVKELQGELETMQGLYSRSRDENSQMRERYAKCRREIKSTIDNL